MPVEEDVEEGWLRLGEPGGTRVTIGRGTQRNEYGFLDFPVTVASQGLHAMTSVRTLEGSGGPMPLTTFFEELADDWRGEKGEQTWEAIEHGLRISVRRDLSGHVFLTFYLRDSYREDAWLASAVVEIEPGEEMSQVASGVRRLLSKA